MAKGKMPPQLLEYLKKKEAKKKTALRCRTKKSAKPLLIKHANTKTRKTKGN
jgi:hypothetical protein